MSSKPEFCSDITLPKYVISANDQKFILTDGLGKTMDNPADGTVSILDFSEFPPEVTNIIDVPCSVIGPPTCAAVTPDEKLAIVASAMKINPDDSSEQIPDNRLTVIDLENKKKIRTFKAGNQPSGISISRDGKTALVCNRADGTITSLKINGKDVSVKKTVQVCEPNESLAHVAISPDTSCAIGTLNKAGMVLRILLKDGIPQTNVKRIKVKDGPYCVEFAPNGETAAVANTMADCITILELDADEIKVKDVVDVAILPEGMDISPDGKWILACCMNSTTAKPDAPNRRNHSRLVLLRKDEKSYSEVQRLNIDRIAQAAIFTPDMEYIVIAGFENKRLTAYKFEDGKISDSGTIIPVPGQPCTLRTAD
jgi:WD40 repeat protein